MPSPLNRYGLDMTGINTDNFVSSEVHVLDRRRNRAAAPTYGAYFADSLTVVEDSTNRILTRGVHYVCIELYQTLSLATGKEVFGALLVIDKDVVSPISINYQAVGGEFSRSAQTVVDLLNKTPDDNLDYSYYDILNKPETFNPSPHLHPVGEAFGFEYLTHAIEKIRNAILMTDTPMYQNLVNYINQILDDLDQQMKYKMDAYMGPILAEFKRQITKQFLGLGNVENLRTATEEEGRTAARPDTRVTNFAERKYAALSTIVAFKNVLYETFISSEDTNIGKNRGVIVPPVKQTLLNMVNGAIGSIVSKAEARSTNTTFDSNVYPTGSTDSDSFTIVKVTNNRGNRGGIFLAYQQQGEKAYIGVHLTGSVTDNITWRKFTFTEDLDVLSGRISNHLLDTNNPHRVSKAQLGLKDVENLPVVTRSEVLCLDSSRKYVTFDALLLFIKTFMVGKAGGAADPLNGTTEPLENVQILYCPVSNCACDDETPSPSPTPTASNPPEGTLLSQGCVGFNLVGTYANGSGGTYTSVITANSSQCGYTPPTTPNPTVTGLDVTVNTNSTINWVVTGGVPNSQFTHSFGLAGQTPVTNTYSLNSVGAYNGTLNTGGVAGNILNTLSFVNNYTANKTTVVQTTAGTPPPAININSVGLTSSKNYIAIGDYSLITVDINGLVNGRTYNVEMYTKLTTETNFVKSTNPNVPSVYNANTGVTGNFTLNLYNNDGSTSGTYDFYIKIVDSTNASNNGQSQQVQITFQGATTPPPSVTGTFVINPSSFTANMSSGIVYSQTMGYAQGSAPTGQYTLASGSLPPGITVLVQTTNAGSGYEIGLRGTPSQTGTFNAAVRVTAQGGLSATINVTCNVAGGPPPSTNTPPPTSSNNLTSVEIVPGSLNMSFGSTAQSTLSIQGLNVGQQYNIAYYTKESSQANYVQVNFPQWPASFTASGNNYSTPLPFVNNEQSMAGTFYYYAVVTSANNLANTRTSNTANVIVQPRPTTPPPSTTGNGIAFQKNVMVTSDSSGSTRINYVDVRLMTNGKLHIVVPAQISMSSALAVILFTSPANIEVRNPIPISGYEYQVQGDFTKAAYDSIQQGIFYFDNA